MLIVEHNEGLEGCRQAVEVRREEGVGTVKGIRGFLHTTS